MIKEILPAAVKQLSVLRRITGLDRASWRAVPGFEGFVSVFRFPYDATPIIVEAVSGRSMAIAPGDIFLATPGYRESVRWTVGGVPEGGLVPGEDYWVLAESGIMGVLFDQSQLFKGHLGQAKYLGSIVDVDDRPLSIRNFTLRAAPNPLDNNAPIYLVLGTSSEAGKTTAGLTLLRTLLSNGHKTIAVLKATGTTSVSETAAYADFGADQVFDCVDFGLPTTFPSGRADAPDFFQRALDLCLSLPADAVLIECGGDLLGTCIPEFLACLRPRRQVLTTILAASDPSGALGAQHRLKAFGINLDLITGPCTDTLTSRERTEALCGTPAKSMRSSLALKDLGRHPG